MSQQEDLISPMLSSSFKQKHPSLKNPTSTDQEEPVGWENLESASPFSIDRTSQTWSMFRKMRESISEKSHSPLRTETKKTSPSKMLCKGFQKSTYKNFRKPKDCWSSNSKKNFCKRVKSSKKARLLKTKTSSWPS